MRNGGKSRREEEKGREELPCYTSGDDLGGRFVMVELVDGWFTGCRKKSGTSELWSTLDFDFSTRTFPTFLNQKCG